MSSDELDQWISKVLNAQVTALYFDRWFLPKFAELGDDDPMKPVATDIFWKLIDFLDRICGLADLIVFLEEIRTQLVTRRAHSG